MSCSCGQTVKIILPTNTCPDTGNYTASNENLDGFGVYKQTIANNFQFYGITSSDGTIDVNLDGANNVIDLALDAEILAGSFPDATTATKGKVQLATDVQAQAKASTTLVLTPSNLAALGASTTFAGLTEYATSAETITGTDTTRTVTPAGLKAVTDLQKVSRVTANTAVTSNATPAFAGQLLYQQDTKAVYAANSTTTGDWVGITIDYGTLSGNVDLVGAIWFINGVSVPINSLLIVNSSGNPASITISDNFLSNYNVITYTQGAYTTSRTVGTSATVTLAQLADLVYTLIDDMKANVKPDAGG
jgi:hypothetical protein